MLYQLYSSKGAGHMLKKEGEFSRSTFCLPLCSFSFLFLWQTCVLQYTPYLISNVPGTNSYTSSHTHSYHLSRCVCR